MRNQDNAAYLKYTGPQRIDKAMHSLEGIVRGIAIDRKVNNRELRTLTGWIGDHRQYSKRHPFNEVLDRLNHILRDGVVDDDEKADILWLCNKFSTENAYFSKVSSDMQRLQGIMGGIAADGKITVSELEALRKWMDDNTHLRTCWPYDEIDTLILSVLQDGAIDQTEHNSLLRFFSEFIEHPGHRSVELPETDEDLLVKGVCAVCPEVNFRERACCWPACSPLPF